jgi:hypothetical protein
VAFGLQLDHDLGAQGRVVLGAAHPLGQLPTRARPNGKLAVVERHEHRVQARGGRPAVALAGRLGVALPNGLGVARGHAEAVAGEGFTERRPGGAQLGGGRIHRAESFGELEGAFGLGPVGEEAAGLPAHPPRQRRQPPLLEGHGAWVSV